MPDLAWAVELIKATGTLGAVIASTLVGLALVLILYARTKGIVGDTKSADQAGQFQERLLDAVKLLTDSEAALRRENAALREDMGRLTTSVELMRVQNRRVIECLRAVMEGRVQPAAITIPDLGAPA